MSFRTKKSLDMYCKSSYILLVVAACAVTTGGEKSSATVGKTKVISTTGTGGTSSLQRLGSGGLGSSSQLQRTSSLGSGSLSSTGTGNATIGSTRTLSSSSLVSSTPQPNLSSGAAGGSSLPRGKVQHRYGVSAGNFNVFEVPDPIDPNARYVQFTNTKGQVVTYKESLSVKLKLLWGPSEIGIDEYIGGDGKVHKYIYRARPNWVSGADILNAQGGDGGSSSLPQQQGNISSTILGSGNRSVGTQTDTGNLGGLGTPKKDTGTSPTTKKYTSQLNLNVDKDGNITKQNKGTNTGDGAGLGTNDGISKTQLNVNRDGKVVSRSIGTNTGTPSGVSETELNIDGSGKVTTRSVGTNTESVGETTSVVTPLGGDKDFSDSYTQTVISGSGLQPKKSTNKGVGIQTDPNITGEGLTSLVAKSDGSQTSSGDGRSIPVKSVVYKFGKMPRFTAKGSEGDAVKPSTGSQTSSQGDVDGGSIPVKSVVYKFDKMPRFVPKGSEGDAVKPSTGTQTSSGDGDGGSSPVKSVVYNFDKMPKFTAKGNESDTGKTSTSVGTDVASGGEKTTKPLTDTGSGGDGKTYTSTLRINLGGTGQPEVVSVETPSGNRGASGSGASSSLGQQSSSSQTGSGAAAQGGSGSSPSGNKGALSSGQQGQGSLSQQSASGSGAQGGSGDGSGGKKTPSSPVSGQATSSSAQQIEVKDEEGKTHQAVLVSTKGTSGGGVQGSSGSSPSGNKGASSSGQQGQGSLSQQSASGSGAQGGSGDGSGGKKTPSSPVSGQATSSSAQQIEVKDEEGKTHQAVLVNTKGTSGGGASKKPGLSTIVEEGESSKAIGEQGKKSSSTQTGSGASTSGSRGASLGQQSSSLQTGSGAGAQGSSGSSTSGKGASSSGQQGQGSSSQQSASGSGAQGGSGDGSGGKKTPPSGQQGGDEDGIFVSKKDAEKFKPMYVGKSLEELMKMSNGELRDYFLKRNPEDDFKGIDLSAAKGLTGDELDEFVNTRPVITYELDGNGYTIIEVNNTAHILGTGGKVTRKAFGKLPDGRVVESILIDRYVGGYRDAVESSRHSSSTTSTGTVPSGQTAQFETSGGAGAQGASGASAGGSKASSSSSAQKEQGKKGTGDSSSKPIYVGTSLKDLQGLSGEELISYSKNAPTIDWDNVKLALPKASTEEEAKDLAKKNPVYTYEVDDLGDLVQVDNSRWLYGVGEKTISKVFGSDGNPFDISNLEVRFRPYLPQKGDSKVSSTGTKPSTSGSGTQGSGGASQKEGSDSSSTTGNQGGSKVGTSVVGETGQTSTSGKAGTQASSEVNKGGSKTSSTSVEQQKQWDGSGKVDFDEVKKSLKPVSGTTTGKETQGSEGIDLNEAKKNLKPVSGTTGKETQGSEGIDLNETRKNLKPVSGTTTGKETQGSEGIDLNETRKNLKPVSGTTTGKETQGSEGIDLNEAKKNLRPVSGTTTEKETGTSEGIDLNEAKKNLKPVSGTTTEKETGTSEGIDLNETRKNLKPVSGTTGKETQGSEGIDLNEAKKNLRPVSGSGAGTQKTGGDYEGDNKQSSSLGGKQTQSGNDDGKYKAVLVTVDEEGESSQIIGQQQTQGSKDVDSGTSGGKQKPTVTVLGYSLNELKALTQEQVIKIANDVNKVEFNKVSLNVPKFTSNKEAEDFAKHNPIYSVGVDQNGDIVVVNHSLKYLGVGNSIVIEKHKRNSDGNFTSKRVLEVFRPYVHKTSTDDSGNTTVTVSSGSTPKFVTSVVKIEQASSEAVEGKKSSASLLGKQTQQGSSSETVVEQKQSSLKKGSTTTTTDKSSGSSGGIDFDEAKKNLRPVSGTTTGKETQGSEGIDLNETRKNLKPVSGTTGKETQGSEGIDLNEAKKNLRPVSGTTTEKETGTSEGIDLNETRKNLKPVSGTTTGKETQGSEGIDLNETRKNLKPVSGTTTEKETGTSEGIDLNEAKKNLRPVSGSGAGTQGTDGDNTAGKKSSASLLGKQTQQGSSSETVVEQKQSSLKKGSTTTTTDKSSGSSGGIDFDEAKKNLKPVSGTTTGKETQGSEGIDLNETRKNLKPVTQSEKSGGESSGAVTQTELQIAIASLKKTGSIGQGMYDSDSDDDNDTSKYILLGKSYGTSGGRGQIDFQKNVSTDETLVSSQGKPGFVKAVGQVFNTMSNEDGKIKVSNQTGSINIYAETDESGDLKINTSTTSKNLEDGIGLLNVDPKFAKTLARNIEEGYQKKLQEMESRGLNQ